MPISLLPSLLLAILLVGYTPGPANLFALHCSMRHGVGRSLVMWLGLAMGFTLAALCAALATHWLGSVIGRYVFVLQYVGGAYLLCLAWQIYRSSCHPQVADKTCSFLSGLLVQLTNAKMVFFDLMAFSTFVLPYSDRLSDLLVLVLVLELAGPGANLAYLLAGGALQKLFSRHARMVDTVVAMLLAACAFYVMML